MNHLFLYIAGWGFLFSLIAALALDRRCRFPLARFFVRAAPICWGVYLVWETIKAGMGANIREDLLLILPILGIVTLGAVLSWGVALFFARKEDENG